MNETAEHPLLLQLPEADRAQVRSYLEPVTFPADAAILREGATDRDVYLLLSGSAQVRHGTLQLRQVGAGDQVGELGLLTGRPRTASVTAIDAVTALCLSVELFDRLTREQPLIAAELMRALVSGLGNRLRELTENVGALLRERSLPRRASVELTVAGGSRRVPIGTIVRDVLETEQDGRLVVAALFDRRLVSLNHPISSDCDLVPVTTGHWEGLRIYRQSLALLLMEAAHELHPPVDIHMGHSLGFAQRVGVRGPGSAHRGEFAAKLQARMAQLTADAVPLRQEWWTVDEAIAHFSLAGERGVVALLSTWRSPAVLLASYGEIYSLSMGPLLPSAELMRDFHVVADGDGLLLVHGPQGTDPAIERAKPHSEARAASRHASAMTREHKRWLGTLQVDTVGGFNQRCIQGEVSSVIRVSEGFHEKRASQIADEILHRKTPVRLVCISGPSSSGKTTFIRRLKVQLQVNALHPVELSLDNYYVNRAETPRDAAGEYDYEALEALNLELLHDHLHRLLDGEPVTTAHYDFGTGDSHPAGGPCLALDSRELLMIEGIHGLNPRLLQAVPDEQIFRIFICPLAQLPFDDVTRVHASDVRLLRRIVRDRHTRGATAADNIARWPSVRRGERLHIFPYQDNADAVFDSSLIYELSVLKVFAERYLLEVPRNRPEYATAFRLLQLTDQFVTIYPNHVPPTSILREFIGGSGFEH